MKRFLVLFLFLALQTAGSGQTQTQYLKIASISDKSSYKPGEEVRLAVTADIIKPFHINSNKTTDPTLIPTTLTPAASAVTPIGVVYPADKSLKFEFSETEIPVFDGKADFGILWKVPENAKDGPVHLKYSLNFQACDDKVCYPPRTITDSIEIVISGIGADVVKSSSALFSTIDFAGKLEKIGESGESKSGQSKLTENERTSAPSAEEDQVSDWMKEKGMFTTLLLIFLGGLALNLTPCIYPLIPITLSFFGAQASGSKTQSILMGVFYALGMAVTYSTLGVVAALTGGILGTALQNPLVIIVIALIMIALAASMFGLFEIRVPQSLAVMGNKNRSGYFGSLLMGLTVGFIAAPCIGPFVLSLLVYVGKLGDAFTGFILFFVLALGLGLPFIFLAASSSSISKLPRSGEWMIGVKVIFGLILIGMALFTLQPLIPENIFSVIFPLFIILSGVYLLLIDKKGQTSKGYALVKNVLAIVAVIAGTWLLKPEKGHEEVKWTMLNSIEAIDKSVIASAKPVIIDFYADWCAQCKELDKYTYTDPGVVELTRSYNNIKIDLTQENEAITSRFDIKGLPVVVFMGPDGKEFRDLRVTGFLEPEEFIKRIEAMEKNLKAK